MRLLQKMRLPKQLTLWLVLGVFIAPFIIGLVYFIQITQKSFATTQRGEFVSPTINLSQMPFYLEKDIPLTFESLKGRWVFTFITDNKCSQACIDTLYAMNQIRLALGKKTPQLTNLILFVEDEKNAIPITSQEKSLFPTVRFATLSKNDYNSLLVQLPFTLQPLSKGRLYLIDPQGYLMMSYNFNTNPSSILKDLKKIIQG